QDESVLEVATDKVDTEVPSIHAGVLKQILAREGDVVAVGSPIAIIETAGEANGVTTLAPVTDPKKEELKAADPDNTNAILDSAVANDPRDLGDDRFYSPLVLSIAKEEGISKAELAKVSGTGKDARVTKHDMLNYLASKATLDKPT